MTLPSLEEYLKDFEERCSVIKSLDLVKDRVIKGECPFLDCNFEKSVTFREMRRYYRQNLNLGLRERLLDIIWKVQAKNK